MSNAGKQATCDHLVAGYQGGIVRGYQRIGCACADLTVVRGTPIDLTSLGMAVSLSVDLGARRQI